MFLQLLHIAQAGLAAYGGQQSYTAVTNLQKYEDAAKKAAKYSNEAQRQLHKTRTTQTSGALAITASLLTSLYLFWRGGQGGILYRFIASPVMAAAVYFARTHIAQYWSGSKGGKTAGARVPLPKMGDYNEAQRRTEELLQVLDYLMFSWVATALVALFKGY
ncbi:hypothetical protein BKA67DRAFT_659694 [Truncatella angustata]|uniref:Uncharacterized protein n=1 Tax=Truncatella angustata TaxID=152316 RepID=A0A9P8UIW3_9PEZI|nr:uncharacterized protein BKA67DRAFT_659694 [Truncatella angustata]KAH6653050.1 hypothetical protein BKA67DRAFT_659694 [Truncatella angustata]KAH8194626.1 hypothetical protein TruAng_011201 [Truncatella angustata]